MTAERFGLILIYLWLIKGAQSYGKVVYFTTLFPYVVLTTLLVYVATLPGFSKGVEYYITPDWRWVMFLSISILVKVEYMFLMAGKSMPGSEKLSGELLFPKEKKKIVVFNLFKSHFPTNSLTLGTIHLRRRHILGGEGLKIGQICRRIVVKNCRRRGVGVKNCENLPTS